MQQDWESAFVYCLSKQWGTSLAQRIQTLPFVDLSPYEQKVKLSLSRVEAQYESLWQEAWASGVPETWRTWEPRLRSATAVLVDTGRVLQHRQRAEWRLFHVCVVGLSENGDGGGVRTISAHVSPATVLCWQYLADWRSLPYRIEVLAHDCALKDPQGQHIIRWIAEFNRTLFPRIRTHQQLLPHWGKFVNAQSRE